MTVFQRYLLIQVPGWVLAIIILYGLHRWVGLPAWAAVGLYAAYVLKDFILYPFLRSAYDTSAKTGLDQMIGEPGVVTQDLNPSGYVRVRGELWQAEAEPGASMIPKGSRVRVRSAQDMTLIVAVDADPAGN